MVAPIACSPFKCWSTGRAPIAQPPGNDTRARPVRASSGPSTRTDARIVLTSSYGASGWVSFAARSSIEPLLLETSTPICASSFDMVRTSMSRGRLVSLSGPSVSSAAHRIGSAAFFAPETRIAPSRRRPPRIFSLSMDQPLSAVKMAFLGRRSGFPPLVGRERLHGERVDLFAHPVAERGIYQLVALHAALAGEGRRDDQCLEVLAVAEHLEVLAGEPGLDAGLDA